MFFVCQSVWTLDSVQEILWLGNVQKTRTIPILLRKRTEDGHLQIFIGVIFIGKFTVPWKSHRFLSTVRAKFQNFCLHYFL